MEGHDLVCLGHLVVSIGIVNVAIVVISPSIPGRAITITITIATVIFSTDIRGQITLAAEFSLVCRMCGLSLLLDQGPGCWFRYIRFGEDDFKLVGSYAISPYCSTFLQSSLLQ